jgi:hypothetical protein
MALSSVTADAVGRVNLRCRSRVSGRKGYLELRCLLGLSSIVELSQIIRRGGLPVDAFDRSRMAKIETGS